MRGPIKLSVVIPTYNRRDVLARTLSTVFAQDFPPAEYEVVVVVDGSTDGTVEMLRTLKPPCLLRIVEQPNRGQAAARNAGIKIAQGDLILFLDDDILCDRALFRQHVAAHDGAEPQFVFGPVLLSSESPCTLAAEWTRHWVEEWISGISPNAEPKWAKYFSVDPNTSTPRSTLLTCGGFDETFARHREDADLGFRLWKMGVRLCYLPTAVAQEIFVKTARDLVCVDAAEYGRNVLLLCRKHPEYRPYSVLARLGDASPWRQLARQAVAGLPVSLEPLLRVPYALAERFCTVPLIRRLGLRLLIIRHGTEMYRSVRREAGSWKALQGEFGMRLPVLIYHHVGLPHPRIYPGLSINPQQFERQVRWLARRGYVGVRPSDWLAWCREGRPLPNKPVLLTFDDAYAGVAEYALPVLRRYGFGGVVFVVTGQIGGTNAWDEARGLGTFRLMSAEQIRHWAAQGIEFGAHSRTHPDLTTLGERELADEVAGSGQDLSAILGTRVVSFAYPYGLYNEEVRKYVQQTFDLAFSCEEGLNTLRTEPELLRRTMVLPEDSLVDLAGRAHFGWSPLQRFRARLRLRSRTKALLNRLFERRE